MVCLCVLLWNQRDREKYHKNVRTVLDAIDPGLLRKALDQTQKRYLYFSIRVVRTPAEILLDDNPLPWVLKESEAPLRLSGEESNFYMIGFRYKGNCLYIDGFYGMTDGNGLPTLEAKKQTMKKVIQMRFGSSTMSVSYAGRSNLGACEKYIRQIFTEVPGSGILIEVNAINDVFCLAFIQYWEERTYLESFCKELEECGISYLLKSEGPMTLPEAEGL